VSARFNKHPADRLGGYSQASPGWRPSRGAYPSRGYTRGGRPQVHRNRTLVLNGSSIIPSDPATLSSLGETPESASGNTTGPQSWVTKTDRHLQLINTSIFEKDSLNRAKAMEETRKQRLRQRDEREKAKFNRHIQRLDGSETNTSGAQKRPGHTAGSYEITVQGMQFRVTKNGSKLVKIPGETLPTTNTCLGYGMKDSGLSSSYTGDINAAKSTPKTALVGGVRFYRSKNGNLFRSGIIKAHRYGSSYFRLATIFIANLNYSADFFNARKSGLVRKVDELCKTFTNTGSSFLSVLKSTSQLKRNSGFLLTLSLSFLGSCPKGPRCRYIHDHLKVAVCRDFLQKGSCPSGDMCDLSHELTPERTPMCLHFAKGNCSNPNCRYTHVRVSPAALVCRAFGIYGFCEKGASCDERHVHECPEFSNTGTCSTKGCKLQHRHKASVMRTNASPAEDDSSDISSVDEDEEIDSDDVDSDDLNEEFFGDDEGEIDMDIPLQQDFVQLS
jgi:hypothetical protein